MKSTKKFQDGEACLQVSIRTLRNFFDWWV